ncbi:pro-FMRFamide-related neuropeptide VF isoform X2 [Cololabis saira]|uniref:pro-FMRFamide-related neuropeptide VF isoform X2 n=1 Tax=Cololabis saira TaxID=129043 RepID=UPI002AD2D303|nr:pro-FMRFamide-related neuropeptide VF isoform X2 [Cololabis saira]
MLTMVILSTLLMLGGVPGAAASDPRVLGQSIRSDNTLKSSCDSRHNVRTQPPPQTNSGLRRSLDVESFSLHVSPTTSKISLPTIIKLYPPTTQPLHWHANMPLRFGRESSSGDDREQSTAPNMPQRFGRSREGIHMCAECRNIYEAPSPVLPQRFGRNAASWRLLRALASGRSLNPGLHWYAVH